MALNEVEFRNTALIIAADSIASESLLQDCPELAEFLTQRVDFSAWNAQQAAQHVREMARQQRYQLAPGSYEHLVERFEVLRGAPGWASARDADTVLASCIRRAHGHERTSDSLGMTQVPFSAVQSAVGDLLLSRGLSRE